MALPRDPVTGLPLIPILAPDVPEDEQTNIFPNGLPTADDPSLTVQTGDPLVEPIPATMPAGAPLVANLNPNAKVELPSAMQTLSKAIPIDPFENLSKNQRKALAFMAVADAGASIQGREGKNFQTLLGAYTERADMERKRQAALAQRQMLGTVLSGSKAGTLDPQAIIDAMALGVLDPQTGTAILTQMEKQRTLKAEQEAIVGGGAGALEDLKRLTEMISSSGMTTGFTGWLFSNLPFSEASAARDVADTLRSGMALGALKELKAGGATLGSVSEKELELLESAIAKLNLDQKRDKVLEQMATIEKHYKDAIRRAYNRASETEKQGFDSFFGGTTPAWVLDPSTPEPTPSTRPSTDDLTEEEKKRLGL